jgi:hypothetical protein
MRSDQWCLIDWWYIIRFIPSRWIESSEYVVYQHWISTRRSYYYELNPDERWLSSWLHRLRKTVGDHNNPYNGKYMYDPNLQTISCTGVPITSTLRNVNALINRELYCVWLYEHFLVSTLLACTVSGWQRWFTYFSLSWILAFSFSTWFTSNITGARVGHPATSNVMSTATIYPHHSLCWNISGSHNTTPCW